MNNDISIKHRFRIAIEILATGKDDVRYRLKDTIPTLNCIRANDVPLKFRKKWISMWKKLSERESEWKNDSRSSASLRKMKKTTGQNMAKLIYDISCHLEKMY